MDREIINVTEFEIGPLCNEYYWENVEDERFEKYFNEEGKSIKYHFSDDYENIDEIIKYYDLDKSYELIDTIIKRKSDNKYFKCSWNRGYYKNYYPKHIKEVFPRTIEQIIYE